MHALEKLRKFTSPWASKWMLVYTIVLSGGSGFMAYWLFQKAPSTIDALSRDDAMAYALAVEHQLYAAIFLLGSFFISAIHVAAWKVHEITCDILNRFGRPKI